MIIFVLKLQSAVSRYNDRQRSAARRRGLRGGPVRGRKPWSLGAVCALHGQAAHTWCKLWKKFKNTFFFYS